MPARSRCVRSTSRRTSSPAVSCRPYDPRPTRHPGTAMLKTLVLVVLAALALAVGLLLAYASTRPDSFRVERSTDIQAPPERIFALINDLKSFNSWNPYEKKDPAIKGEYSPVTVGPGARYGWGSKEAGGGSLEITEGGAAAGGCNGPWRARHPFPPR